MKKLIRVSLIILAVLMTFSVSGQAANFRGGGGGRGGSFSGFHGGGRGGSSAHFHRGGHGWGRRWGPGIGIGIWGYPYYGYPYYPYYDQTNYSYYCQNPPGYYPYVTQCPSGWMVIPYPPGQ